MIEDQNLSHATKKPGPPPLQEAFAGRPARQAKESEIEYPVEHDVRAGQMLFLLNGRETPTTANWNKGESHGAIPQENTHYTPSTLQMSL